MCLAEDVTPYQHSGAIYCRADYMRLFGLRCHGCAMPIDGEHIYALGVYFHPDHHRCARCQVDLSNQGYLQAPNVIAGTPEAQVLRCLPLTPFRLSSPLRCYSLPTVSRVTLWCSWDPALVRCRFDSPYSVR